MLFDNLRHRVGASGNTPRENWISIGQRNLNELAPFSPAYKTVDIDGVTEHLLIVSRDEPNEKTIRMMPGRSFRVGQILTWNKTHWLITQKDEDDEISMRGKIEQCNRQLKWQNHKTGEIITRWCTAEKPYYSNFFDDRMMAVSTREFKIQLPYDAETAKIGLDMRFMLDEIDGEPKTYKVTSVDSITERYDREEGISGFLVLNVRQDLYKPDVDDKELGLCDYIQLPAADEDSTTRVNRCAIAYSGKPTIRFGGSAKKLTFEYSDTTQEDLISLEWETNLDAHEGKFEIQKEGLNFVIRALDYAELEGLKFTVTATDQNTGATASVDMEVTS